MGARPGKDSKMEEKREIHGIDQAVCLLMLGLDSVFAGRVEGWQCTRNGFRIVVIEQKEEAPMTLRIYPVGLPEDDFVICKFIFDLHFWSPYKGVISCNHSAVEIRGLSFKAGWSPNYWNIPVEKIIESSDDLSEKKIREILARDSKYKCRKV